MAYCPACGEAFPEGDKFCRSCGSRRSGLAVAEPTRQTRAPTRKPESEASGVGSPGWWAKKERGIGIALVVGAALLVIGSVLPWGHGSVFNTPVSVSKSGLPLSFVVLAMGAVVGLEPLLAWNAKRRLRGVFPIAATVVAIVCAAIEHNIAYNSVRSYLEANGGAAAGNGNYTDHAGAGVDLVFAGLVVTAAALIAQQIMLAAWNRAVKR